MPTISLNHAETMALRHLADAGPIGAAVPRPETYNFAVVTLIGHGLAEFHQGAVLEVRITEAGREALAQLTK